jgi:hypothetical protein
VTQLFADTRLLFHDDVYGRHIDVFFNALDFCHKVSFVGRLEVEDLTLPLAELVLEKMQIVQINEKDLIDTIMLIREHPMGETDKEMINTAVISKILANDWGYWRTVTANLRLVDQKLSGYANLSDEDRKVVHTRLDELQQTIEARPKTLIWKARAAIGERIKWYKDVEELMR